MESTQIKALVITIIIFSTTGYFLVLQPLGYTWDKINLTALQMTELGGGTKSDSEQTNKSIPSSKTKNKSSQSTHKPSNKNISIDKHNGVEVYYNGLVSNVRGRNVTKDGYNLGLKYQCVEFVKRYYYEYLNHKMPDSYGHAKDFFQTGLADGSYNRLRDLYQYINGSSQKPKSDDLLIYGPTPYNSYGHVAIVTEVSSDAVYIIQQNPGPNNPSRDSYPLESVEGIWKIQHQDIIGWLRKN